VAGSRAIEQNPDIRYLGRLLGDVIREHQLGIDRRPSRVAAIGPQLRTQV
jgi:hypothetical protein